MFEQYLSEEVCIRETSILINFTFVICSSPFPVSVQHKKIFFSVIKLALSHSLHIYILQFLSFFTNLHMRCDFTLQESSIRYFSHNKTGNKI